MANPFEKYLSKEDHLQRSVIQYLKIKYPEALAVHIPNEGKRTPFERFKFKTLGGLSGMPDVMVFYQNSNRGGLAIELKVGYNKPTENQKNVLKQLQNANWEATWVNSFDKAKEVIDNYFKNA
jgi:hypothetical protein